MEVRSPFKSLKYFLADKFKLMWNVTGTFTARAARSGRPHQFFISFEIRFERN